MTFTRTLSREDVLAMEETVAELHTAMGSLEDLRSRMRERQDGTRAGQITLAIFDVDRALERLRQVFA